MRGREAPRWHLAWPDLGAARGTGVWPRRRRGHTRFRTAMGQETMEFITTLILLSVVGCLAWKYRNRLLFMMAPQLTLARRKAMSQSVRSHYRTKDGLATYSFDFVWLGDEYRIYILTDPDYGGRGDGGHSTHRQSDGRGLYVCWDSAISTLEDAKRIAAAWADGTQSYIKFGEFDPDA